jgi:hypothetical protein
MLFMENKSHLREHGGSLVLSERMHMALEGIGLSLERCMTLWLVSLSKIVVVQILMIAGLLSKPNGSGGSYAIEGEGYWPTAEFQVYRYYASSMKGQRLRTTASSDGLFDAYATVEGDVVRILAGTRSRPGNWTIDVVGLTDDTRVKVKTLAFRVVDGDKFKRVDRPHDLEEREEVVKEGKLKLRMKHQDPTTAFAFELSV